MAERRTLDTALVLSDEQKAFLEGGVPLHLSASLIGSGPGGSPSGLFSCAVRSNRHCAANCSTTG
jgi:hypothetical protein